MRVAKKEEEDDEEFDSVRQQFHRQHERCERSTVVVVAAEFR
jgi:hypothetical protein